MRTLLVWTRLLLTGAAVAAALTVTWRLTGTSVETLLRSVLSGRLLSDAWTLDALVADLAAAFVLVAVAGLAAMLALGASSLLLQRRSGRLSRLLGRVTPSGCRRLVAACCGIGLAAPVCLGAPAMADGGSQHACPAACHLVADGLSDLPLPDLPVAPESAGADPAAHSRAAHGGIVVRVGDSLWAIAESRVPATASVADVAGLADRLYLLNRSTIGGDPNLILPGMTLVAPKGTP